MLLGQACFRLFVRFGVAANCVCVTVQAPTPLGAELNNTVSGCSLAANKKDTVLQMLRIVRFASVR